ncbi:hypothetical protein ElyMa_000985600 [Elysia marginata]|uniref:Fibronectin type-III domain-containing protein n=1 Tax=Elysia marginata TaxID=1093978 RepID=A0AAV4HG80_9GAST|nr:hypothetical protein ElyMa_000985600 [Elysia marginata]
MAFWPEAGLAGRDMKVLLLQILTLHINTLVFAELLPPALPLSMNFSQTNTSDMQGQAHLFSHFKETYDWRVFGKITLHRLDVSPSSIKIGWNLTNRTFTDSVLETSVICETFDGKMVSDKLHPDMDTFQFQLLRSNTEYTICVYMLEISPSTDSKVLHFECAPFQTIPVVRSDSVLGVALTLGYIVLMGGMGYVAWWRRSQAIKHRLAGDADDTAKINVEGDFDGSDDDFNGRYAENIGVTREMLKAKSRPGCSGGFSRKESTCSEPALNGSSGYKNKGSSLGSLGAICGRPQKDQHSILYNAKDREITF